MNCSTTVGVVAEWFVAGIGIWVVASIASISGIGTKAIMGIGMGIDHGFNDFFRFNDFFDFGCFDNRFDDCCWSNIMSVIRRSVSISTTIWITISRIYRIWPWLL
jgi:hypothetical protein